METDYFECSEVCRITWITEFADPFADFQFVVRKPGMDARWVETKGLNGTTYFYVEEVEGPFYFEVEVRAIISWKITVEQLSFESLESSWFFLGGPADGILTGIFTCEEHCVISWMTEYEDHRWSAFGVGIRQLWAEESFSEWFSGLNGTTHLYAEGTFYFKVYTTDIIAWAIAIEKVPLASIEPETSFSGVGGAANTGIFMCEEHCVINWTAESLEYDWGNLMVNIREPGEQGKPWRARVYFEGPNGSIHFYHTGLFYFDVISEEETSGWEITVEEVPLASLEPRIYFSGVECPMSGTFHTEIFTCEEHCVITWTTEVLYPEQADFEVEIFKPGEKWPPSGSLEGFAGTTHWYMAGTFHFEVWLTSEVSAWEITVEEVLLASMEPSTSFSGVGSSNTGIFTCPGYCVISWTTESEDPGGALFIAEIKRPGEEFSAESVGGTSGTKYFDLEGTYYFDVDASQEITAWEITVGEETSPETSTTENSTIETGTTETTKPEVFEGPLRSLLIGLLVVMVMIQQKRQKR